MLRLNPAIPNNILVCDRHESFGEYARTYGDELARHYEKNGIVYIPHMPITFDLEFVQALTFPAPYKKIGTADGIEKPVVAREGNQLGPDKTHPFLPLFPNIEIPIYLQTQVASFNSQLRRGLSQLFPKYYSLQEANITWRLTETGREGMHLDIFRRGAPEEPHHKHEHRLKLFINIDKEPRQWHTSLTLPEILKTCRADLPDALPEDINVINDTIDKHSVLEKLPYHSIDYPTMSAVIANGETVAHEVVFGRRVIGAAFICDKRDMLDPSLNSHNAVGRWLRENGYKIEEAMVTREKYQHLKGGYARLQEQKQA